MEKLNTHTYDGLIKNQYKDYINKDDNLNILSITETLDEIYKDALRLKIDILNFKSVMKILSINQYDDKNDIKTHELIPIIWKNVKKNYDDSGKLCFFEHLLDILKGQCAQGVTTRIFISGSWK